MHVGLIGTYDVENYGDCLFPHIWIDALHRRFPDVRITLFSPTGVAAGILEIDEMTALPANPGQPFGQRDDPIDLMIVTGGEVLGLGHGSGTYIFPRHTLSAYLRLWLTPIAASMPDPDGPGHDDGVRCVSILHAVGLAPPSWDDADAIADVLRLADHVTVRDAHSAELLGRASKSDALFPVVTDPVYLVSQLESSDDWRARAVRVLPPGTLDRGYLLAHVSQSYLDENLDEWVAAVATAAGIWTSTFCSYRSVTS